MAKWYGEIGYSKTVETQLGTGKKRYMPVIIMVMP